MRSFLLSAIACALAATNAVSQEPRVLIALSSYRERNQHPQIYLYEHDGVATGKIIENVPTVAKRSDNHASLSSDGRYVAFAAEQENETSKIRLWDRQEKKLVELPTIDDSPNAQLWPTLAGDGRGIAFAAWNRPGSSQRWDLFHYDVAGKRLTALGDINTQPHDERMPALSADGRKLAFVTNEPGGAGLMDIVVCELATGQRLSSAGLNTGHREVEPALSADGRWLAFSSDRSGGVGGRDIYLYEVPSQKLVELPGLNSVAHEQTPSISPDGRWLAFVSERIRGEGERDVFLYDVAQHKLVPTPGLNAKQEDIDPCVIALPAKGP